VTLDSTVYFCGFAFVIIKGVPKILREFGWDRPDEH